jgi:hypothetical protein
MIKLFGVNRIADAPFLREILHHSASDFHLFHCDPLGRACFHFSDFIGIPACSRVKNIGFSPQNTPLKTHRIAAGCQIWAKPSIY